MSEELSLPYIAQYQEYANEIWAAIQQRDGDKLRALLDSQERPPEPAEGMGLTDVEIVLLSTWNGVTEKDSDAFFWIGYELSIAKGYEDLVANFFILKQQLWSGS
ncbi:MAG TPA: hypothetical protein V6C95_05770 [Coleofasciculaceae cyanobacterium]